MSGVLLSENPVSRPARRGYTVSYKGKTLLSTIDPVSQSERIAAGITRRDRTLYFCPSPLLGYGLDTLLSLISKDSAILCVETDEQLFALSRSSIKEEILDNSSIALTGISNSTQLCRFVREKWGARVFRRIEQVKLSGGWQLDQNYEIMAEFLQKDIALDWGNAMTLVKLGRRFTRNVIRNLSLFNKALPVTQLQFGTKPVLVLGAGPSLDKVLDSFQEKGLFDLDKDRRPFVLICVDTCLTILRERKIVPDLTVVLESQFWNLHDFAGSGNTQIPVAADFSAYPGSLKLLNGPLFFFFTPWTPLRLFDRLKTAGFLPPVFPPLGSVSLSAVELAKRFGSGPVICAGIDFSFSFDSQHARSSPSRLDALLIQNRFSSPFNLEAVFRNGVFTVFSKSKVPVKSDPAMRNYRDLFEREFSDPRIKDINGSGLPLGQETLDINDAYIILAANNSTQNQTMQTEEKEQCKKSTRLADFMKNEKTQLEKLRSILSGDTIQDDTSVLDQLLDDADYLWAHFPDCAGTEGRRPLASDITFLKRVRAELDPFITIWELAEREIER